MIDIFKTKDGRTVIAQPPNWPITIAAVCWLVVRLWGDSLVGDLAGIGLNLSLGYWSYLELFYGVNLFRRLLGLAGAIAVLTRLFG